MDPARETLDLGAMRLLAHPLRQRIERELRQGPVNATKLARALGISTGLTSYHLRQLARYGFVEEVAELARGRERWWRFVPKDRRFRPRSEQDPQTRAVLDEILQREFAAALTAFTEAVSGSGEDGPWTDAFPFSFGSIEVTVDELREFFEAYIELLHRYRRPEGDTPEGARRVITRFFAYPETPPDG